MAAIKLPVVLGPDGRHEQLQSGDHLKVAPGNVICQNLSLKSAGSGYCTVRHVGTLTADRMLDVDLSDAGRSLSMSGNLTVSAAATVSGTNTGDQNLFSTIAVSGQSSVVADATGDTLTLVAGSNITITTDASTDTITISATGGAGVPTQITVADTTDTTCYVALFESATGDLAPKTDAGLTYDASTQRLTCGGGFFGNLSGIATEAFNAASADVAMTIDTSYGIGSTTLLYPALVYESGASVPVGIDVELSYNALTDVLTCPTFSGDLDGNATSATSAATLSATLAINKGGTGQTTAYAALDALTVQGSDIASASTTNLATATGVYVNITGTTTITAHGTAAAGVARILKFAGALTYTHNATSLILPTAANITTAANDTAILVSLGSGNWRCVSYQRADGTALAGGGGGSTILGTIVLREEQSQNTAGGTFTSGAWRTRTLNTEVTDTGGDCSLSSNQFTLTAGTYLIWASAPAYNCSRHQAKLYNVTDSVDVIIGSSDFTQATTTQANTRSVIAGRFTVAASKALEIRHQCQTTATTTGFGVASNFTTEVYTEITLLRIA